MSTTNDAWDPNASDPDTDYEDLQANRRPDDDVEVIEIDEVIIESPGETSDGEYTAGDYPEGDVRGEAEAVPKEGGYTAGDYPEGDER